MLVNELLQSEISQTFVILKSAVPPCPPLKLRKVFIQPGIIRHGITLTVFLLGFTFMRLNVELHLP